MQSMRRSRRRRGLILLAVALTTLCVDGCKSPTSSRDGGVVAYVGDGDTLGLEDGRTIRLVQIDAPEATGECFGAEATAALERLVPRGAAVELERDPVLDDVDVYDRLLRYVLVDGVNINVVLVRVGAAAPYFFRGDRGRYAVELLRAATEARSAGNGLWGACPAARLDPNRGAVTGRR